MSMETENPLPHDFDKLKPFKNQVGGHSLIFKSDDKVLKSASIHEFEFYSKMRDDQLAKFIPKFYGTVDLKSSVIVKMLKKSPTCQDVLRPWSSKILERYCKSSHGTEEHVSYTC